MLMKLTFQIFQREIREDSGTMEPEERMHSAVGVLTSDDREVCVCVCVCVCVFVWVCVREYVCSYIYIYMELGEGMNFAVGLLTSDDAP